MQGRYPQQAGHLATALLNTQVGGGGKISSSSCCCGGGVCSYGVSEIGSKSLAQGLSRRQTHLGSGGCLCW